MEPSSKNSFSRKKENEVIVYDVPDIIEVIRNAPSKTVLRPLRNEPPTKVSNKRNQEGKSKASESKKKKTDLKVKEDVAIMIMTCHPAGYWKYYNSCYKEISNIVERFCSQYNHMYDQLLVDPKRYEFLIYVIFSKARYVICNGLNLKSLFSSKMRSSARIEELDLSQFIYNADFKPLFSYEEERNSISTMKIRIDEWEKSIAMDIDQFCDSLKAMHHPLLKIMNFIENTTHICISYDFKKVRMYNDDATRLGHYKCAWTDRKLKIEEDVILFKMICSNSDQSSTIEHYFYLSLATHTMPLILAYLVSSLIEYRFTSRRIFSKIMTWIKCYSPLGEKRFNIDKLEKFMGDSSVNTLKETVKEIVMLSTIFKSVILPSIHNTK